MVTPCNPQHLLISSHAVPSFPCVAHVGPARHGFLGICIHCRNSHGKRLHSHNRARSSKLFIWNKHIFACLYVYHVWYFILDTHMIERAIKDCICRIIRPIIISGSRKPLTTWYRQFLPKWLSCY